MNIGIALKRLGFTQEWIDFGIVSSAYIHELSEEITVSDDKNAEHYRNLAFSRYLNTKKNLTDIEIINIFNLKDNGPDNCDLLVNRIFELLHSDLLTNKQLNDLVNYPEVLQNPLQKLFLRKKMMRKIEASGVNACFSEIMEANDPEINDYIRDLCITLGRWKKE
jgi:Asp-tRNA(Asn)/Glu-tRNA(Gln) amidotransferase B subunit